MANRKFWFVLFISVGGIALAGDALLGRINDISEVRIAARQFREEAVSLKFSTKNLIPNIGHVYRDWNDSDSSKQDLSAKIRRFQTDRNGYPIDENDKSHHKITILFLGGSTTECNEVDEKLRFPTVVQHQLRGMGFDVATANAGVRGHTTQDSINALLNRPGFRQADIIVMMENINDRLRLGIRGNYNARLGTVSPTSARAVVSAMGSFLDAAWDFLAYRSNSLFVLKYWADQNAAWHNETHTAEVTERSIDLYEDAVLQNREKYKENLQLFVNIVRTLGKRPVLMTQPLGLQSNGQNVFNEIVRDIARRYDVLLIDLDKALGQLKKPAFLFDNIHLNNTGSEYVGELIASSVAPIIQLTDDHAPPVFAH
jgi:lysophospholipase L1-like esterase